MAGRRVVTGHDAAGKSVVLSDGPPPQHHDRRRPASSAEFVEIWNSPDPVPPLTSVPDTEPNAKPFTIMPASGHLLRILEVYPAKDGGRPTPMHRTKTLDYVVVIEGEIVLILDDSEVVLKQGDVVVQRGTDHAWENRSDAVCRAAFFHIDAEFTPELLEKLPKALDIMK